MSVVYIVLPMAIVMAGVALFAFVRAVRGGQFDDLDTPQHRAMFDDRPIDRNHPSGPRD